MPEDKHPMTVWSEDYQIHVFVIINIYFNYSVDLDTPVITLTPPSDTINETEALTLNCSASSSEPNIQYNWFFQDDALVINNNKLQFNSINRTLDGTYRCDAFSAVGVKNLTRSNTTKITITCKFFFMLFFSYCT